MKNKKDYIVDELLGLNGDEYTSVDHSIEEEQKRILQEMRSESIISTDMNDIMLDPKDDGFVSIIKENVNFCVNELKEVNTAMNAINNQKNTEMFFKKGENIKLLSQYMSRVANVNQKTLDLLILLLGASGKISDEYETILATIDELGKLNNGEAEVLNYLLKIKKMVYEIRDNDEKLKQILEDNAATKEIVTHADEAFKKEIEESEKSRKLIESKCNRLQKRLTMNNLYIGVCLLLIIIVSIFIGLKFYVL